MNDRALYSRKEERGNEPKIDFPPEFLGGLEREEPGLSKKEVRPPTDSGRSTDPHRRRLTITYLLCVCLGYTGAHKFYLGKPRIGLIYLGLGVLGIGGWIVLSAWILGALFAGFSLLLLFLCLALDLLTIPRQLRKSPRAAGRPDRQPGPRPGADKNLPSHKPAGTSIYWTSPGGRPPGRRSGRHRFGHWIRMLGR
jgi:hypothetical protein